MPNVLPTIPNDPPQGIQALLDKVYLWNPDVSNELIEKINALMGKLGDAIGAIRPYGELVAPINQYEPCYYGDGVYVAARELTEVPAEFNEEDWILIATKTDLTPYVRNESDNGLVITKYPDISWQTNDGIVIGLDASGSGNAVVIGEQAKTFAGGGVAIGHAAKAGIVSSSDYYAVAVGNNAQARRGGSIQIGAGENNTRNTFSVGLGVRDDENKFITYRLLESDGTIPAERMGVGGLEGQVLTKTSDGMAWGDIKVTFAEEETTIQNAINTLKTDQDELGDQVSAIESKIPADASETNQLVTKNEVLALPTFTYTVVNELPETGEEKIIYLVPKAGEGNDVHDEYIWVNGGYELIGTTAVDLSGYLPLSGGTLTGLLTLTAEKTDYSFQTGRVLKIITESEDEGKKEFFISANGSSLGFNGINLYALGGLISGNPNSYDIGQSFNKWRTVFTTKLNNGADIAIPTTGGTLALAEDIAESVTTKDLTVGTDEGTLNIGITAGVATIATNNGLDIVSQTKFDTAPTTDDATAWADVNSTALVTKQQVASALGEAGSSVTIRNWA